jgi:hypothetical protein
MIFGVHNHYNNNADTAGNFTNPASGTTMAEIDVRLTDQGLVIFNLNKRLKLEEKLRLADALNGVLQKEYGTGISFATCGFSDCLQQNELIPYYSAIKKLNPSIVTTYTTNKRPFSESEEWIAYPKGLKVDHVVEFSYIEGRKTADQLVAILKPTDNDKAPPSQGWGQFYRELQTIFSEAKSMALSSSRSAPEFKL